MHIFLGQIWILSCTDQREAPSPVSYFHGDRVLVVLSEFISFVSLYTCPDENTHAHHEAACKSVQENRSFCKSPNTHKVQILITLNMSVSICLKRMCMYLCISTKKMHIMLEAWDWPASLLCNNDFREVIPVFLMLQVYKPEKNHINFCLSHLIQDSRNIFYVIV